MDLDLTSRQVFGRNNTSDQERDHLDTIMTRGIQTIDHLKGESINVSNDEAARVANFESAARNDETSRMLRFVGSQTLIVAIGRAVDIVAVILTNMILARWLAPKDITAFLVLFNAGSLLSICGTLGLNRSIVRFVAESLATGDASSTDWLLNTSWKAVRWGALISGLVMGVTTLLLYSMNSISLATVTMLAVVLRTLLRQGAEILRGFHDIRGASLYAGQNAGQACGPLVDILFLMFVAAAWFVAPDSLVLVVSLNIAAMLLIGLLLQRKMASAKTGAVYTRSDSDPPYYRFQSVRELVSVSSAALLTQIFIFLTWHSDLWLAEILLEEKDAALFAGARNALATVMVPLAMIDLAVVSAIPKLYAQKNFERLTQLLQMSATMAAIPTLSVIVLMLFFGGPILSLMYGSYYTQGAMLLAILASGRIVNAVSGPSGSVLMMTGRDRIHLVISLSATAILWGLAPLAVSRAGATGLAVVSASVFLLHYLAVWLVVRFHLGLASHPNPKTLLEWRRIRAERRRNRTAN